MSTVAGSSFVKSGAHDTVVLLGVGDFAVTQRFGYYPLDLCNFRGNSVIMQHDILPPMPIPPSVFPQYTVTKVSRDQLLALIYTPYDLEAFKNQIIDDTVNILVMFNMHLRQRGLLKLNNIPYAYLTVGNIDNSVRWHIHISSELKADNKGLYATSSSLDARYSNNAQDRIMNLANFRNGVGNFVDEPRVRQSIENNTYIRLHPTVSRNINRSMGTHLVSPSNQTVNGSPYNIQEIGEEEF
ncbi:MAG: hypothetical protein EZS28_044896 [Streblomastix strix]|uniref:Uncharacterized protein n=1 Tax=Streblomastix strix TaxID=222440 RepID=A0A5J4TMW0_9EUKA|nr:MAG: hypothetical protein EZS28_044896 [Streblomastix strix]